MKDCLKNLAEWSENWDGFCGRVHVQGTVKGRVSKTGVVFAEGFMYREL